MTGGSPIPVIVLTGFLGSGKTTLLQHLLETEDGRRAAVLINEFGEISLDHLLVKSVSGSTVVLQNGCVCCSVRSELRAGLRELIDGMAKGEVPPFDRIVIETTGLADPVPVVQTITVDPMLRNHLRLASLVSTVDALNGIEQIDKQCEAMRQAATADRLVITKTDLSNEWQIDKLQQRLMKCAICLRRAFQVLEDDATLAGSVCELLFVGARSTRINIILGFVLCNGPFRFLGLSLQFIDAILKPDVCATCCLVF